MLYTSATDSESPKVAKFTPDYGTCKQLTSSAEMRKTLCIVKLKFMNSYATNVI